MHLQQSKGIQSSKQDMWKGNHLSLIEDIRKGNLFREKWEKNGKGLDFLEVFFLFSFWFA